MSEFWTFQPKDDANAALANQFARDAQSYAFKLQGQDTAESQGLPSEIVPTDVTNPFDAKPALSNSDLSDVNKDNGGGGILGKLDDVTSTVFGGPVRAPWDLLRPVQRVLEAEHNAIAVPIAKALTGAVGVQYDDLPGIVQAGLTTLTDPLTYIAPESLAKLAPTLKVAIPTLAEGFDSPGSARFLADALSKFGTTTVKKAAVGLTAVGGSELGGLLAQQIGGPQQAFSLVGGLAGGGLTSRKLMPQVEYNGQRIINPSDVRVYNSTNVDFEGMPSIEKSGSHYTISAKGIYTSVDPDISQSEAGITPALAEDLMRRYHSQPDQMKDAMLQPYSGVRTLPLTLKKGANLFEPSSDPWPKGWEGVQQAYENGEINSGITIPNDPHGDINTPLFDNLVGFLNKNPDLVPHTESQNPEISGLEARNNLVEDLKSNGYQGVATPYENIAFDENILEPAYLPKNIVDMRSGPGTMRALPQKLADIIDESFNQGLSGPYLAANLDEAWMHADQQRSLTQALRGKLAQLLPDNWVRSLANNYGLRLRDDDVTYLINEHGRFVQRGPSMAAVVTDTSRHLLEKGGFETHDVPSGTIIDDLNLTQQAQALARTTGQHLVSQDGSLYATDLARNHNLFTMSPEQHATMDAISAQLAPVQAMEIAHGLNMPEVLTPNGAYVHLEPLVEGRTTIPGTYGSKPASARVSQFSTQAEGVDAGINYMPFVDAQGARVEQGFKMSGEKWLNAATSELGKKPTELIDPKVVNDLADAARRRGQLTDLETRLINAVRNPRGKAFVAPQYALDPSYVTYAQRGAFANSLGTIAERRTEYSAMLDQVRLEQGIVDPVYNQLKATKAQQLAQLRSAESVGAKVIDPATGQEVNYNKEWRGSFYPEQIGSQLQKLSVPDGKGLLEDTVGRFNSIVRPLMATLDASFLGVQGLIGAAVNPGAYADAAFRTFQHGYGDFMESAMHSGLVDSGVRDGIKIMTRNDYGEFLFPNSIMNFVRKVPVAGRAVAGAADLSNTWFTNFGNILRLKMYDSAVNAGADGAAAARAANLATGYSDSKPTRPETIMEFAPRFFRAQIGLVADAITKHDLGPAGALRNLSQLVTEGTLLTVAANKILGQTTEFDPSSPNFMRIDALGQKVSVFGPWDTLVRAINKGVHDPTGLDAEIYLARSKASPAVSRLWDIVKGETYSGQKLSWGSPEEIMNSLLVSAKQGAPIALQGALQNGLPTTPGDVPKFLGGAALQLSGTKSTPPTAYENMLSARESLAQSSYGKSWAELEPYQKNALANDPSLQDQGNPSEIQKAFNFRSAIDDRFKGRQEQLDSSLPIGRDWLNQYENLRKEQAGAFEQWSQENPQAAASLTNTKPKTPLEAARQQYFGIFDTASKEQWSTGELSQKLADFENSLSQDQLDYIQRNTGMKDTPRVAQYRAAQKVLQPYWAIQDQVWAKLKGRIPEADQFTSVQDYTNDLVSRLQAAGVPDQTIVKRIQQTKVLQEVQRATDTLHTAYRRAHPEADAALVAWYGDQPVRKGQRTSAAAQTAA